MPKSSLPPVQPIPVARRFAGSRVVAETAVDEAAVAPSEGELLLEEFPIRYEMRAEKQSPDAGVWDGEATFTAGAAADAEVGVALRFDFPRWSRRNYVFMPAALYNGNRQPALPGLSYPPLLPASEVGPHPEPFLSDVPRFAMEGGSKVQLLSGDAAAPMSGFFDAGNKRAFLCLGESHGAWGENGWEWSESADGRFASLSLQAPGVRERRYVFPKMTTGAESPDRGVRPRGGASVSIRYRLIERDCESLDEFFDIVWRERLRYYGERPVSRVLPFSEAARIIEAKNNTEGWREDLGLYLTSSAPGTKHPYQNGWCGGLISTLPLLVGTAEESRRRAWQSIQTVFERGMADGPLPYGRLNGEGIWEAEFAQNDQNPQAKRWTLTRRHGDVLYFLLKQVLWLESKGEPVPSLWVRCLEGMADHFDRLWRRHGQFGQFLDQHTGEIAVGGSTSGAIVPAALILAGRYFEKDALIETANEAGRHYWEHHMKRGHTTSGPGDALQNPDSESAAALVESFVALAEHFNSSDWWQRAAAAARFFATWVMPYDYPFPEKSEFGRLGMESRGTVFANTQNKHSAPGICTHSGEGLFRLYRATGDVGFLHLIRDIAGTLPQYLSREDRPIRTKDGRVSHPGWINERVNTSDWDDKLGEIFYGPCWCEVALSLTSVELPGIYARRDSGLLVALDHVECRWTASGELEIGNPTDFPAEVRVLVESGDSVRESLPVNFGASLPIVSIPAGGQVVWPAARDVAKE